MNFNLFSPLTGNVISSHSQNQEGYPKKVRKHKTIFYKSMLIEISYNTGVPIAVKWDQRCL